MDFGEGSSNADADATVQTIQIGHTILLRLPSSEIRTLKLEKDACVWYIPSTVKRNSSCFRTVNLGKFGAFTSSDLVGQPYGLTYDIVDKKLRLAPPRAIQEVGMKLLHFRALDSDALGSPQRIPRLPMS